MGEHIRTEKLKTLHILLVLMASNGKVVIQKLRV